MAQERYHNYKAVVASDAVNRKELAIIPQGLYRGFDMNVGGSTALGLVLYHDLTGYKEVKADGTESGFMGVIKTRQGFIIKETAALPSITVTSNAGNSARIDLIYVQHEYSASVGGVSATYGVITGTPASTPLRPALTVPLKQVAIGLLMWEADASDITGSDVHYTRLPGSLVPFVSDAIPVIAATIWTGEFIAPSERVGWTYTDAAINKELTGRVNLRGMAVAGSGAVATLLILPIEFRPGVAKRLPIMAMNDSGTVITAYVGIDPDGVVTILDTTGAGGGHVEDYTYVLDSISFIAGF